MVYCIFTAGASAHMGYKAVEAVRPYLKRGGQAQMTKALQKTGAHRFPVARPAYIVKTRAFLREHCGLKLHSTLLNFSDAFERRDWLAQESRIKGLGYKESSHFLRNIGFRGYAILDKHVVRCLAELGLVDDIKPPSTRTRYLEMEEELKGFAREIGIDFDELDLVLWSMKTGEVLK
jgi:N-glycosylase/DNA lyase